MPWINTSKAACVWGCKIGEVHRKAARLGVPCKPDPDDDSGVGKIYDVPMTRDVDQKMFTAAPVVAQAERWRQWCVDVGLLSETDELERLIIDIDVGDDHAHFWVQRKGDVRQLAVKPPKVELF